MDVEFNIDFEKSDASGKYVRGFAYVMTDASGPVTDYSGQFIDDIDVLRDAAHDFMENRISKSMHGKGDLGCRGMPIGEVVESIIIDDDVAKALGMSDPRRGWFVGVKVDDVETQKRIRNRDLTAMSLSGRGKVEKLAEAA